MSLANNEKGNRWILQCMYLIFSHWCHPSFSKWLTFMVEISGFYWDMAFVKLVIYCQYIITLIPEISLKQHTVCPACLIKS